MKTIRTILTAFFIMLLMNCTVFAANASLDGTNEKTSKGKSITGSKLVVSVNANEAEKTKDSITIKLDGAEWSKLSADGNFGRGVKYEKISNTEIKLHAEITEDVLKNGWKISIPLECKILYDSSAVKAVVDWGLKEYSPKEVVIAHCDTSYAYLNGDIKEHKKGDRIFQKGSKTSYNKLKIRVIGNDAKRTRNSITVTLDGAEWTDYEDDGKIEINRKTDSKNRVDVTYTKLNSKTIKISVHDLTIEMEHDGYLLTLPLTGTITGSGEIKAVVDFGCEDTKQSSVVFARCADGGLSISAPAPQTPIDLQSRASDVVITDTSTQGYSRNTKIELKLNLAYHFAEVPALECTGKFENKCRAEINKNDDKQCIITITDKIQSGDTGTITLVGPVVKRPEINVPKTDAIKITMSASGWEKYTDTAQIGTYTPDSGVFQQVLRVTTNNPNAQANEKYAYIGKLGFTDVSERSYKSGSRIEMYFDNGFKWYTAGNPPTLAAEGKFKDKCKFECDPEHPEKAYIVFTSPISGSEGKITLTYAVLYRDTEGSFEKVMFTAGVEGDSEDRYSTILAAKYSSLLTRVPDSTTTTTETVTETTTAAVSDDTRTVIFKIGDDVYTVNGAENTLLAPPYIKDGYTMLPMRALANLTGITDDNITYSDGTAVFVLGEGKLSVTAGAESMQLNGSEVSVFPPAEIINGTMFLPMRDLLYTFGIDEENIMFDAESKKVIVIL